MMFSGSTWGLLLIGALLTRRWSLVERSGTAVGPVVIGLLLLTELGVRLTSAVTGPCTTLTAALALCGLIAWGVTLRGQPDTIPWGGVAWTLGGLLVLGQTHDLLLLGLGWEILRHGVRLTVKETPKDRNFDSSLLLSFGGWTAIAGLVLFAGTTDIDAMMHLAKQLYTPVNQAEPLGRASLLLIGALALLIVSVCGTFLLPAPADQYEDAEPRQIAACGRMHLQWGAALLLATLFTTGCPGVSGPITDLVSVLVVVAWGMAMMALGRADRWCELADAAVRFHGGAILLATWLLLARGAHPSSMQGELQSNAPLHWLWGLELLHGGIAITALLAALSWRRDDGTATDFVEASRGAAMTSPWSALWTVLPLASLIGLPGLWGSWTRLATGAALLSVQSLREDELAVPVGSIIVVAAAGILAVGFLSRGTIQVVSVLCWEPLIGRPRSPGNGWPQVIAALLSVVMIVVGCCPLVIPLLGPWLIAR